ncbi:MAG: hypothetical protein JNM10_09940 [Planctomycetia bacterium]|nr:hypothetical protein [Planctomycetia bacterium]
MLLFAVLVVFIILIETGKMKLGTGSRHSTRQELEREIEDLRDRIGDIEDGSTHAGPEDLEDLRDRLDEVTDELRSAR